MKARTFFTMSQKSHLYNIQKLPHYKVLGRGNSQLEPLPTDFYISYKNLYACTKKSKSVSVYKRQPYKALGRGNIHRL